MVRVAADAERSGRAQSGAERRASDVVPEMYRGPTTVADAPLVEHPDTSAELVEMVAGVDGVELHGWEQFEPVFRLSSTAEVSTVVRQIRDVLAASLPSTDGVRLPVLPAETTHVAPDGITAFQKAVLLGFVADCSPDGAVHDVWRAKTYRSLQDTVSNPAPWRGAENVLVEEVVDGRYRYLAVDSSRT